MILEKLSSSPIRFFLPLASVLLLWSSFPPFDIWPLAWISLVPLFIYLKIEENNSRKILLTCAAGYFFFCAAFHWLGHIAWFIPFLFGLYNVLYFLLFVLFNSWFKGKVFSRAALWTVLEFVRGSIPVAGLPWFLLGYTQHSFLPFVQAADLLGTYFLTFVIALVNSAVAESLIEKKILKKQALAVGFLLLVMLVYGGLRIATFQMSRGPVVLLIQPNIPQEVKNASYLDPYPIYEKHVKLTEEALKKNVQTSLVVWPESGFMFPIYVKGKSVQEGYEKRLLENPSKNMRRNFLIGAMTIRQDKMYNSTILVDHEFGATSFYDKINLVPFGEYVPFVEIFPFLGDIVKGSSDLSHIPSFASGNEITPMFMNSQKFGSLVCFEGISPWIVSRFALSGAGFIVNISNDGWFKNSSELDQILNIIKLRAIESRVSMIRGTNTGISCFVSPLGTVEAKIDGKQVEGYLAREVSLTGTFSLYRITGDLFPGILIIFLLARKVTIKSS